MRRYLLSGFLLLLPVLAFNAVFAGALPEPFQPETFWRDIPGGLAWIENAARIGTLVLPVLMPIPLPARPGGWWLYSVGIAAYLASWLMLMLLPASGWSTSIVGFAAPAFTPALWLGGIGLVGRPDWPMVRWAYFACCAIFIAAHVAHTLLVFSRL